MRRAQAVFLLGLAVAAGVILAQSSLTIQPNQWPLLVALIIVYIVSDYFTLVDVGGGGLSFAGGGLIAALLIGGPRIALWAAALGILVESLIKSRLLTTLLFNLGQAVLAGWVSFQLYEALGGGWGPAFNHPAPVLAMAFSYMLLNSVLYALILHTSGVMNLWVTLRMVLDPNSLRAYTITLVVGTLFGLAYLKGGTVWAATVAGLAFLLHNSLRRYFFTLAEVRSQAQQLEAVLNATQGALVMTDRDGMVKVANRQSGVIFGILPEELIGQDGSVVPELARIMNQEESESADLQHVMELTRGPARYVQWYRAAVRTPQGELQGHVQVFTDVTALKEAEEDLRELNIAMIKALTAAIDARDSYTHGHSSRVAEYSVKIGQMLGLAAVDLERLGYAALLHDIGKLGITDRVLNKKGPLSPDERALMMQHPVIGSEVLNRANVLPDLVPGIRWHHEWVSGGGYPDGLSGVAIPMDARIIGVADAFDAMTTDRQYRAKLPVEEALRRVENGADTQFDADVALALIQCVQIGQITLEHRSHGSTLPEEEAPESAGIRPVHGKELSIFYQLSQEDYTTLNLETMLHRTLETLHQVIGSHIYMVYLKDPESADLALSAAVGLQENDSPGAKDRRLLQEAIARGGPVVVRDTRELHDYRPAGQGTKSEVVIPLVTQQESLGVMVVEAAMPDLFGRDEIYLLETMSQQICGLVKLGRFHERLTHAANHDSLTGVFNHSYFHERLSEEVDRAARSGRPTSVAVVDVLGLQAINDALGHSAGDQALRYFGRSLYELARPQDVVARHGGDEFAVILPDTCAVEAVGEVRKLLARVEERIAGNLMEPRICMGPWAVATYPEDGLRAAELVAVADRALFRERQRLAVTVEKKEAK